MVVRFGESPYLEAGVFDVSFLSHAHPIDWVKVIGIGSWNALVIVVFQLHPFLTGSDADYFS